MNNSVALCRASIAHHSKSFALASRLLPTHARDASAVVYAWCRRADDAIDLSAGPAQAHALDRLRAELDGVYSGAAQSDLVLGAFQAIVLERAIPREYPSELLAGMQMDVEGYRYETLGELLKYCYRVASTVGLMMCHVMGVSHVKALDHAAHLGIALQLTNVCRDVLEDWQRGRLYLPADVLRRHGADPERWALGGAWPRARAELCRSVLRELLELADRYYASGDAGLRYLSPRCALAVDAARRIYSAIGTELARSGHDVLAPRAQVSLPRKLLACVRAGWATFALRRQRPAFEAAPLSTVVHGTELIAL